MAKTKKTRKELLKEPDEFITTTGRLIQWAIGHQTQLTYALLAVVVIALGFSAYRFFSLRSEAQAAQLLHQAMSKYERLQGDKTAPEIYAAVSTDFQSILDSYGDKNSGKMARLRFANICYEAGEYEQAAALYREALPQFEPFPLLHSRILTDLALAEYQMGRDQAAIDHFEQILAGTSNLYKDEALFHLGGLYDRAGREDESRAAYARLSDEFKDSTYLELIPNG